MGRAGASASQASQARPTHPQPQPPPPPPGGQVFVHPVAPVLNETRPVVRKFAAALKRQVGPPCVWHGLTWFLPLMYELESRVGLPSIASPSPNPHVSWSRAPRGGRAGRVPAGVPAAGKPAGQPPGHSKFARTGSRRPQGNLVRQPDVVKLADAYRPTYPGAVHLGHRAGPGRGRSGAPAAGRCCASPRPL
jgi:hypothetical protein